jgi:cytochrome c biogenesis protein CcdA
MAVRQISQPCAKEIISMLAGLLVVLVLCTGSVSAGVFLKNGSDVTGDNPAETILADPNTTPEDYSITFFYNKNCGACHLAMAYLNEYSAAHPKIAITTYDLFNSSEGKVLFEQYKAAYHRPYVSVPSLFIGNAGLEGESAIRENFEGILSWYEQNKEAGLTTPQNSSPVPVRKAHLNVISIPLVLIAGLVDGINPCASAVIIFLLILLMSIRERQRILLAGVVFTSAVYFMYFVSGTGIYNLATIAGFLKSYSLIAGIIAAGAGLLWIRDGIVSLKEISSPNPEFTKKVFVGSLNTMVLPIAFVLGLLTGVLELSCTGGIYLSIMDMIAFRVNIVQGLVYLFLYNLVFIVPLLVITLLVWRIIPDEETESEPTGKQGRIILFTGMLLLFFSFIILSSAV